MAGQTTRGYPLFDPTGADVGTRGSAYFNAIAGDNDNGFTTMVDKDITKLDETKLTIYAKTTPQWNIDTTTIIRAGEFGIDTSRGVVRMGNGIDIWAGLSDYLPNIPILTGNNPPNSSTVGVIGQLYLHTNPDKQRFWICRNINLPSYTWEAVAYISDLEELQEGELLMLKSIYDTNNNNIVDNSERLGGDPPSAYLVDTLEFYLDPELWVNSRQAINNTLLTGAKPGSIYINPSASEEQIKAYKKANLFVVEDAVGLLMVEALGVVPTIPLDICVELRGGVGNIFVVGGGAGETTVNNVGADSTGNITLTAADIPMAGEGSGSVGEVLTPAAPGQMLISTAGEGETGKAQFGAATADMIGFTYDGLPDLSTVDAALRYNIANLYRPNILINGGMEIWQRGTSFSVPANTAQYTADRRHVFTAGADIIVQSRPDLRPPGVRSKSAIAIYLAAPITSAATTQYRYIFDPTDFDALAGETVTASVYIWTSDTPGMTLGCGLVNNDAVLPTSYTEVAADGGWHLVIVTFTMPDTWANAALLINCAIPAGSPIYTGFYVCDEQLVLGDTVGPYIPRPYAQELALCQRYYERVYFRATALPGLSNRIWAQHMAIKRIVPTVTVANANETAEGVISYYGSSGLEDVIPSLILPFDNGAVVSINAPDNPPTNAFYSGFMSSNAEIYP